MENKSNTIHPLVHIITSCYTPTIAWFNLELYTRNCMFSCRLIHPLIHLVFYTLLYAFIPYYALIMYCFHLVLHTHYCVFSRTGLMSLVHFVICMSVKVVMSLCQEHICFHLTSIQDVIGNIFFSISSLSPLIKRKDLS